MTFCRLSWETLHRLTGEKKIEEGRNSGQKPLQLADLSKLLLMNDYDAHWLARLRLVAKEAEKQGQHENASRKTRRATERVELC